MSDLTLPPKVQSRACYTQLLGAWCIVPSYLESYVQQVAEIGIEAIWARNEKLGEWPMFSPAVDAIAEHLGARMPPRAPNPRAPDNQDAPDQPPGADQPAPYMLHDGTAIIPVSGPLTKMPTSMGHVFGGSSTVGMRKALMLALADSRVQRIMLHVDSPGGSVAGTGDLADELYFAQKQKPTAAYIEDLGASAAYWLAAQTQRVYASPHAHVGSIGVYTALQDSSERAKQEGIKVHVIKTGPYKGGPVPGAPVTDQHIEAAQEMVNRVHESFVGAVARGRNISAAAVNKVADGRVFMASDAMRAGLVDSLASFRTALRDFSARRPTPTPQDAPSVQPTNYIQAHVRAAQSSEALSPGELLISTDMNASGFAVIRSFDLEPKQPEIARAEKETDGSSTVVGLLPPGASHMADPATPPAGQPPAVVSPEAVAELQRQLQALTAQVQSQQTLTLTGEKDRLMATYPGVATKEDMARIGDLSALQSVEAMLRRGMGSRSPAAGADPAAAARLQDQAKGKRGPFGVTLAEGLPDATAASEKHLQEKYGLMPSYSTAGAKA